MICVSISRIAQIKDVLRSGAALIELRLDLIKMDPGAIYAEIPGGVTSIATCRPGIYGEKERIALLKSSMDLGARYIDVEMETGEETLNTLKDHAKQCGTEVIVSYHHFEITPDREALFQILQRCYDLGGSIAKIATLVNAPVDTRNLIALYDLPGKKVVIGMGKQGRIIRIMAPYLGAAFTFASPEDGGETAPGQFSHKALKKLYNVIDAS